jgi:methylenetetrahydrofolate dehydrogenase (NADP+)/methenyltetrahydrofolate cyclohydrolase
MIIGGKSIATEILSATRTRVAALGRTPVVRAVTVAPNPATESYLRIKETQAQSAGMKLEVMRLPETATNDAVIDAIRAGGADAIIVQLPLPAGRQGFPGLDTKKILDTIPREKDADVLSHATRESSLLPPVVGAVKEIFERAHVEVKNKKAVVVGKGWLVGDPVAAWLTKEGAHVSVLTRESGDLEQALHDADIVVSGAGSPHLIKPAMLKQGVVLIDAGTSESDGALAGDADPACADVASVFTPVPGGVGPIAVACLFRNVVDLLTQG